MIAANIVAAATARRILVIEDDPSVAAFLRPALECRGYEVELSRSATEGLQLLPSSDFGEVISDFRTQGGRNGADVHHWLLGHRPALAGRIIFITGGYGQRSNPRATDTGWHALLRKTVSHPAFNGCGRKNIGKP